MAKTAGRKGQRRRTGRKPAKGGMWPWYLAGVLSVGAAVAYDHRAEIAPMAAPFYTASIVKVRPVEKRAEKQPDKARPALAMPTPGARPVEQVALEPPARLTGEVKSRDGKPGTFYFCTETLENCVVDGGTFWYGRKKIQIADIQAPRIKQAKCDNERKLGSLAKRRLWEILNAGKVQLAAAGSGKAGTSGQDARVTVGEGRSIGDMLVAEGLARRGADGKRGWCAEG